MSDLPTLTVDGDPADWLPIPAEERETDEYVLPETWRDTVRVDDLPTVRDPDGFMVGKIRVYCRFLHVDDRVTLATEEWETTGYSSTHRTQRLAERPFATATVTHVQPAFDRHATDLGEGEGTAWLVTVSDVKPINEGETNE